MNNIPTILSEIRPKARRRQFILEGRKECFAQREFKLKSSSGFRFKASSENKNLEPSDLQRRKSKSIIVPQIKKINQIQNESINSNCLIIP